MTTLNEPPIARPFSSSGDADTAFADILAAATSRTTQATLAALNSVRPLADRSSAIRSTRTAASYQPNAQSLGNDDISNSSELPYADLISATAKNHGVNPDLVAAVVKAESGFNPLARSRAGAKGLMQLMDGTARSLGVSNTFDPAQNIEAGVKFLSSLLRKYNGDPKLALAAYNAGPGAVDKYGGIPPYRETKDYVAKVLSYWQQFSRVAAGGEQSAII